MNFPPLKPYRFSWYISTSLCVQFVEILLLLLDFAFFIMNIQYIDRGVDILNRVDDRKYEFYGKNSLPLSQI